MERNNPQKEAHVGKMTTNDHVRESNHPGKTCSEEERRTSMRKSLFSAIGIAVVVIAYAVPSLAQTTTANNAKRFAKEALVEENAELTFSDPAAITSVDITMDLRASASIAMSRSAAFTFTLSGGATFAEAPGALVFYEGATPTVQSSKISQTFASGGSAGSRSVTYNVSVAETGGLSDQYSIFRFNVPKLSNAASILRMPASSSGTNPTIKVTATITPSAADALQVNKFPLYPAAGSEATAVTIAEGHDAIRVTQLTPAAGATSTASVIDISDRTMLDSRVATNPALTAITGLPGALAGRSGIILSTITAPRTNDALKPDGMTEVEATSSDKLVVTVNGNFGDGDVLIFTTGTAYSQSVALSISGRVATREFDLNAVDDGNMYTLYYIPASGVVPQNTFSIMYAVNWAAADIADKPIPSGSARVQYSGLRTMAHAYAIPNPGNADQGNLRIRCQESKGTTCAVFFECRDHDGVLVGDGTLPEVAIPGQELELYQSKTSLPRILGVRGWEGRLSCNIMSTHDVSVQLLVRSGSVGTLTNNTYISGVDQNPPATD